MTCVDGTHVSWKRWWVPVNSEVADATGFLDDPEGPFAEYLDYPTTTLSDLGSAPCLVLLGEAGMGKTTELKSEVDRATGTATPALYVDLGDEPDLTSLRRTLENDPVFDDWLHGDGPMTLWLDSFDEATITIDKLVGGLSRLLQELPVDRLALRLASRSSAWSNRLDRELDRRFDAVKRLTLCPLTHSNAADAARMAGVEPEQFLSQVAAQDRGVLAARPLTLRMLVRLAKVGPLPPGRNQLYRESATLLARENSDRRQEERTADLPVQRRLTLARRLAALTLLTGRPTIRARGTPDTPASTVTIEDIVSNATELADFEELLQSGLFTAAADGAVKFAHRSLAEFLAGESLAAMPLKTATHLLVDPLQPGHVVPQLAGTSVWAASLNADVYRWLAGAEPELLLTANLADASEEQRRILARALLHDLDGPVPPRDRRYTWLGYEGLAADVAPYLADDRESWIKVEAAHVLSHSGCQDLDERLVELIEDIAMRNPPDYLGEDTRLATSLVCALDATERGDLLNRLAEVADRDDAPLQVRAEILGELWGRLPATVLLPIVSDLGAVEAGSPVAGVVATQLATAIEQGKVAINPLIDWLESAGLSEVDEDDARSRGSSDEWQTVVVAAAMKAAEGEDALDDGRGAILARALYAWHAVTHTFLPDRHFHHQWVLTIDGRRRLIALMLQDLTDRATAYHLCRAGLALTEDLEWLLRRWGPDAASADETRNIGMLTSWLVDPTDIEQEQLARPYFWCDKRQHSSSQPPPTDR